MEILDSQNESKDIKSSNEQSFSGEGKTALDLVENRVEELVKTIAKHEKEVSKVSTVMHAVILVFLLTLVGYVVDAITNNKQDVYNINLSVSEHDKQINSPLSTSTKP